MGRLFERIGYRISLLAVCSGAAIGASQFGPAFNLAKAGKPIEECFQHIDLTKIDLAEETPTLLDVLNGSDAKLARRAAGAAMAVLMLKQDPKTKRDARALAPALITHYDDPDPDQPSTVEALTDSWKQIVMYFITSSDAAPPPWLIDRMRADLTRKGDAFSATAQVAAITLSHLRPLPQGVLDALLTKMDESARSRLEMIEALGDNRVDDPRAIRSISLALTSQAEEDEHSGLRNTNVLRRSAARALGQIGPAARDSLSALRWLAASKDPTMEESTREAARQAIRLIEEPR